MTDLAVPPLWAQTESYNARDDRRILDATVRSKGVIGGLGGMCLFTPTTPASMKANVADGVVAFKTSAGTYLGYVTPQQVTVEPSDPSTGRHDGVWAVLADQTEQGSSTGVSLVVVKDNGDPAGFWPGFPPPPAGAFGATYLGNLSIPAGTTGLNASEMGGGNQMRSLTGRESFFRSSVRSTYQLQLDGWNEMPWTFDVDMDGTTRKVGGGLGYIVAPRDGLMQMQGRVMVSLGSGPNQVFFRCVAGVQVSTDNPPRGMWFEGPRGTDTVQLSGQAIGASSVFSISVAVQKGQAYTVRTFADARAWTKLVNPSYVETFWEGWYV